MTVATTASLAEESRHTKVASFMFNPRTHAKAPTCKDAQTTFAVDTRLAFEYVVLRAHGAEPHLVPLKHSDRARALKYAPTLKPNECFEYRTNASNVPFLVLYNMDTKCATRIDSVPKLGCLEDTGVAAQTLIDLGEPKLPSATTAASSSLTGSTQHPYVRRAAAVAAERALHDNFHRSSHQSSPRPTICKRTKSMKNASKVDAIHDTNTNPKVNRDGVGGKSNDGDSGFNKLDKPRACKLNIPMEPSLHGHIAYIVAFNRHTHTALVMIEKGKPPRVHMQSFKVNLNRCCKLSE